MLQTQMLACRLVAAAAGLHSAVALVRLSKAPSAGMLGARPADATQHVLRSRRRRLAITALEVDPDAEAR